MLPHKRSHYDIIARGDGAPIFCAVQTQFLTADTMRWLYGIGVESFELPGNRRAFFSAELERKSPTAFRFKRNQTNS